MSEERLNEIKDSVNFQRKLLWTHNVSIVCVDEAQELIEEIDRLNNIINYIWQVFENGSFEDGCDCIKIYDYLKALKENNNE